jgi:hypothetical protein
VIQRTLLGKWNNSLQTEKKMLANHIFDKELISRIFRSTMQ